MFKNSNTWKAVAGALIVLIVLLSVVPALAQQQTHIVQPGETLGRIAQRYGVSSFDLAAANGITDPNRIRVGQVLVIPGRAAGAATPTPTPATQAPAAPNPLIINLQIPAGRSFVSADGFLGTNASQTYRINGQAGQLMNIQIINRDANAALPTFGVVDVNKFVTLRTSTTSGSNYSLTLPTTGPYDITVRGNSQTSSRYTLVVEIPQAAAPTPTPVPGATQAPATSTPSTAGNTVISNTLTFAAGGSDANVSGVVRPRETARWRINGQAGQTMSVQLNVRDNQPGLQPAEPIISLRNATTNTTLLNAVSQAQSFSIVLPSTGTYEIDVISVSLTTNYDYTLRVSLPPLTGTGVLVVNDLSFQFGRNTTSISGYVNIGDIDRWRLNTRARRQVGVTLTIAGDTTATTTGEPILTVKNAATGGFLLGAASQAQSYSFSAPSAGIYELDVANTSPTQGYSYTLTVTLR